MDGGGGSIELRSLPLTRTRVWPGNPRKTVRGVEELAASIREKGVLEPALARAVEGDPEVSWEILAGQRRFLAAGLAGLTEIPAIVRVIGDDEALELGLVENAARADVDPLEEAEAIERLVQAHGRSVAQVAARLGHAPRWVERRRALLNLTPASRAWATSLALPLAHMQALAAVAADVQARVIERVSRYPASRALSLAGFSEEIARELHQLRDAPFGLADADLGARACKGCQRRSDAQGDLFGEMNSAACLDADCWSGKADALWERAQKDAKKRRLKVVPAKDVIAYEYAGGFSLRHDAPYLQRPAAKDEKPVAIVRRETGHVLELYAKPEASSTSPDTSVAVDDDRHDEEEDDASFKAREEKARAERAAAHAARLRRLYDLTAAPGMAVQFARCALLSDMFLNDPTETVRLARAIGFDVADGLPEPEIVAAIPDDALVRVLLAVTASGRLEDGEDIQPYERAIADALAAPAVPTVRLWIPEEAWDTLTPDDRDDLEEPIGGSKITWDGRVGWVTAAVPEGEVLVALRGIISALAIEVHEGDEQPAAAPTPTPPATAATIELRVNRGDWLQHRSGLQDCAKGLLHKKWEPEGDDRVARVARAGEAATKVLAYAKKNRVRLRVDGVAHEPEALTAPKSSAKKGGRK